MKISLVFLLTGLAAGHICVNQSLERKTKGSCPPHLRLRSPPPNILTIDTTCRPYQKQHAAAPGRLARRSKLDPNLDDRTKDTFKKALSTAAAMAEKAATAAQDLTLVRTYFGAAVDEAQRAFVEQSFLELALEFRSGEAGNVTVSCGPPTRAGECETSELRTLAYVAPDDERTVRATPFGLASLGLAVECGRCSWPTTLVHEYTHALLGTEDYRYERYSPRGLTADENLHNADTWAYFAEDAHLDNQQTPLEVADMTDPVMAAQYERAKQQAARRARIKRLEEEKKALEEERGRLEEEEERRRVDTERTLEALSMDHLFDDVEGLFDVDVDLTQQNSRAAACGFSFGSML